MVGFLNFVRGPDRSLAAVGMKNARVETTLVFDDRLAGRDTRRQQVSGSKHIPPAQGWLLRRELRARRATLVDEKRPSTNPNVSSAAIAPKNALSSHPRNLRRPAQRF
jgi:hypothetical protein